LQLSQGDQLALGALEIELPKLSEKLDALRFPARHLEPSSAGLATFRYRRRASPKVWQFDPRRAERKLIALAELHTVESLAQSANRTFQLAWHRASTLHQCRDPSFEL